MSDKPKNVIIAGVAIPGVSDFRYGQQLHEQRFFELKFRQPLFGSTLSFANDDAASYVHQPITLQFEDVFGRLKSTSGTIVKLEFTNIAGQNAEVIVTGTLYRPSGNISKFTLALIALLLFPFLFTGFLSWQVSLVSGSLTKVEGTVHSFQERFGKGMHYYTFKVSPYLASFYREYHTPVFSTAQRNINSLFTSTDGSYDANLKGQPVDFYFFKNDLAKLRDPKEKVDFFYLKSAVRPPVKFDYYYDLLVHVTHKGWFYLLWIVYLFVEVFFFACALFCYKMYVLDQQRKNRIIWFAGLFIAALLNIAILALML